VQIIVVDTYTITSSYTSVKLFLVQYKQYSYIVSLQKKKSVTAPYQTKFGRIL